MMIRIIRSKSSKSDDEEKSFDHAISITRSGMRLLGFWPQDRGFLYDLQCGTIFLLIGFFMLSAVVQTYTVVYTVTDWNSVMHEALYTTPLIPLIARFIFMKVMAGNFRLILHAMTVDWANARFLTKRCHRIMTYYAGRGRRFSILSTVLVMLSIAGFMLTPIVNMWRSGGFWNTTTRTLPHDGFYPFRNKETPVYEILYVAQSFAAFLGATALATVDCFLYIIVFHICGQFDILAETLNQYDGFIRHDYTKKDARNCTCLSCIVKRHVYVLSNVNIIEKSFRDFLLLQLLGYWLCLILQGRELILYVRHSNIHGIVTTILYVLTIMYYIFIYCYVSECIIEKSENVGTIAHNLEWQHFPRDSNLPIIVARTRIPCKLTAGRFLTLSFPCYNTILTTTISYISVLAAFK